MEKILLTLVLMTLIFPTMALATPIPPTPPLPDLRLLETIGTIANLLFWVLLAISIIAIVWAGILFVTAAGATEKIDQARSIIQYAIIGIIVALLAYGIRAFLLAELAPTP